MLDRRYRIDAPIARGGMSTVYAGTDLRLDRRVAVKVMAPALAHDPAFTERFVREARTAARLSHPNAVAVFDQGAEQTPAGRVVFLVMELVAGSTLRDGAALARPAAPGRGGLGARAGAGALAAAHRAGLVHRDVKPENVPVSADGTVKVVDFGWPGRSPRRARPRRPGWSSARSRTSLPSRSPASPDARTDVYSAGVVLFELLTGTAAGKTRPFGRHGTCGRRAGAVHPGGRDPAGAGRAGAAGDPARHGWLAGRRRRVPGRAGDGQLTDLGLRQVPSRRSRARSRAPTVLGRVGLHRADRTGVRRSARDDALPAYAWPVESPGRARRGASRIGLADGSGWPAERRRRRIGAGSRSGGAAGGARRHGGLVVRQRAGSPRCRR